ncbi:hypothetical protein GE061_011362 [Apolygus lucorum]|uniref:Uncharacterized protein n=1 Tax=Apolygus lucorum TaxID=248454 RepID=A0A8S9XZ89_APOLU|nr:hypothetical protein GE061_011362 [Apolygus lucorum]
MYVKIPTNPMEISLRRRCQIPRVSQDWMNRGGANKEQQDEVVGKTIHVKNKDISGVIAAKHAALRSYFVQTEDQKQITTPLSFGKVTEEWPVAAQPAPPGNLQLSSERRPQRNVRPPQRLDL